MRHDTLRGQVSSPGPITLPVHATQSRLWFDVGPWAVGTLYVRTTSGTRTNGVVAAKHAPTPQYPFGSLANALDASGNAITFAADGSAVIDLVGISTLILVPSTVETGGNWFVEAILVVQGDA